MTRAANLAKLITDANLEGTLDVTGIGTFTDDIIIGDGKTIGSASDVDAITIASNGQLTLTQTLIGTSLDISGDIDVDGTTNLDVVDIDGAVDMASTLTVNDSVTFQSSGSSKPVLTLKNTNADTTPPSITFQKDSASPADNDEVANINFYGDDDGGSVAAYANLKVVSTDVSNGSEDGKMTIKTMVAGTLTDTLILESGATTVSGAFTSRGIDDNADATAMTISSDEDVMIGTTDESSGAKFIVGSTSDDKRGFFQGSNQYRIGLKNASNNHVFIGSGGADNFRVSRHDGSTSLEVNSSGNIVQPVSGGGIHLGVTSATASNLLDDYEEGTWTPSMGGTTTYYARTGVYTKVGNKVFIRGQVSINQIGTGDTHKILGLPFTSESTSNGNPAGVLGVSYYSGLAIAVTYISGYVESAQSRIQISANATAHSTVQYNTGAFFGNGSRLDFSMTYRV